jgi:hypothetical protein
MYAWIWRKLPLGLPGKLAGSLALAVGAVAMLWWVVFPWLDPFVEQTLLPWNDGQLEGDFAPAGGNPADPGLPAVPTIQDTVGPDGEILDDEHDLPYETDD